MLWNSVTGFSSRLSYTKTNFRSVSDDPLSAMRFLAGNLPLLSPTVGVFCFEAAHNEVTRQTLLTSQPHSALAPSVTKPLHCHPPSPARVIVAIMGPSATFPPLESFPMTTTTGGKRQWHRMRTDKKYRHLLRSYFRYLNKLTVLDPDLNCTFRRLNSHQ